MFISPHNTTTPSSGDLPINNLLHLTEHSNNSSHDSKVNKMYNLGFILCAYITIKCFIIWLREWNICKHWSLSLWRTKCCWKVSDTIMINEASSFFECSISCISIECQIYCCTAHFWRKSKRQKWGKFHHFY